MKPTFGNGFSRAGGVELVAKVRNDLADELRLQRGKDLCPPLIHTPLASVPSLVDTGHIWPRFLPAVVMLADICQISSRKSLDSLMLSVYWHFHVYMVTWVGQKSASHIPAPHLSPDSPSGPRSRCWYQAGRGLACCTRLQNGVAASLLQLPSLAEILPEGWTGPRASQ